MQADDRDSASLWDMAQAIRRIQQFTADASCDTYLESVFMQSAVERQLGILGEASRRVSSFSSFIPKLIGEMRLTYAIFWFTVMTK